MILCSTFVLLQIVMGLVATILTSVITGETNSIVISSLPTYNYLTGAALILCDVIMVLLVGYLLTNHCLNAFTGRIRNVAHNVWLWSIIGLFLLIFVINGFIELVHLPNWLETKIDGLISNPLCLFGIVLIGPIAEEVVFRRGIIDALSSSPCFARWSVVISSFLFGLVHFNPIQVVAAFFLGLFLGWTYIAGNRNLLIPIVFHIINNTSSVIMYHTLGKDTKFTDLFPSTTIEIVSLVILLFLFYLTFLKLRKIFKSQCHFPPSGHDDTELLPN